MATKPLAYYDINPGPSLRPFAPNPSKARYALNIKRVPHATNFVNLIDIAKTRVGLGLAPGRKLADGSDFHTLPVLQDPNTGSLIGDSLEIALYLDKTYPDSGELLFPADSSKTGLDFVSRNDDRAFVAPLSTILECEHQEYATFNWHVDATFSNYVILFTHGMPFSPEAAEASKAEFVRRAGVQGWDDFAVRGERRVQMLGAFQEALGDLAVHFEKNEGPFLEGERVTYADAIVGGWLRMISVTMPAEEWEQFQGWHGGVFARLHEGLAKYAKVHF